VTAANGDSRTNVPEVKGYHMGLLPVQLTQDSIAVSHISVRRAIEAVTTDVVASIQVIGHGIKVSVLRNGDRRSSLLQALLNATIDNESHPRGAVLRRIDAKANSVVIFPLMT
jgi:hypothetical protein